MKTFARSGSVRLALALLLPLFAGGLARAEESRFALVIAADGHADAPLPTAANDAALVAETLKEAGFEVVGQRNLD
ncbi:caspase family protein, partial [Mycobacterium tuberculosis]|nr:caspase family protein [Mycobacterium tuberculosis]